MFWQKTLRPIFFGLALFAGVSAPVEADEAAPGPLAFFERLVGGEWHLDNQVHVFEWGVGKRTLRSRSYSVSGENRQLVSEGMVYYHPGQEAILGHFVAIGMGIDLFDYRIEVEGNRTVSGLSTYGQIQGEFEEIWDFTDDDHYEWTLYQKTDEGPVKMMGGVYERRLP